MVVDYVIRKIKIASPWRPVPACELVSEFAENPISSGVKSCLWKCVA